VLENYPLGTANSGPLEFADLEIDAYQFIDQTNFPLNIGVIPGRNMTMLAVYDPSRFTQSFIRRLMLNFSAALQALIEDAHASLGVLPVLSTLEHHQVIEEFNNTRITWPSDDGILDHVAAQTAASPEAIAVILQDQKLTRAELDSTANALAQRLRACGVGPESIVALCLERSLELVVSILTIMKAGGAYLPLDPEDPPERLAHLAQDSGAHMILTTAEKAPLFAAVDITVEIIGSHTLTERALQMQAANIPQTQAAYVIYTSGSTGLPKAVINTHGGLLNRLLWMQSAYPIGPGDRVLQKTPATFDVSVWEFFWPLMTGATLVLAEPGGHRDPRYLRDVIVSAGVTVAHFVPSMLQVFLQQEGIEACTSLRRIMSSGEALSADVRNHAHRRLQATLHNLYGPTEAAIDVTFHDCQRSGSSSVVPIGRPIANTQILLLDPHWNATPHGAVGEIYIGGVSVARGYLHRPELTAERFVPNPFSTEPGARLYRTGDLARLDEERRMLYLGRTDFQVKIRGMRVEIGEIEAALRQCTGVRDCAVLAETTGSGELRLTAHVVTGESITPVGAIAESLSARYRQHLQMQLPTYMIPDRIMFHDALPLLSNGKLNRAALRSHSDTITLGQRRIDAPRTPVEEELVAIWQEVLGLPAVGIYENFFEIGGHSLLLTQVSTRIRQAFAVELPLKDLFNARTVVEMTDAIMTRLLQEERSEAAECLLEELDDLSPDEAASVLTAESSPMNREPVG
jgi:amino acid adenylation domain-containing protein